MTESETRAQRIDQQLKRAGWNVTDCTQVQRELPLSVLTFSTQEISRETYGITDDCLMTASGEVLAVIEAKRSSRSEREGEEQLRLYIEGIASHQTFAPFGFMSNGYRTSFWEVGQAHPRLVAGFFRREDLMRLLHLRRHGLDLAALPISNAIANRPYQHEAIRRVSEHFATGARHALLVMATGTGKTRTTMALIDLFLRAGQAQKVLFVADRDALVEQALTDGFMVHLPEEPRGRIYTRNIDPNLRLYVATLQTLSNCYEQINPGFLDLIVFDEAHRSIFNRFHDIVEYFDARMIGLTATPATFIDRDTFRVFRCANNRPTFLYGFEEAVDQHFLVDFRVNQAQTGFQRDGIHGATISDEARESLIENGIDPDDIDYEGTEIEKTVSNRDTLRRQWEEIMEQSVKDAAGLICKTIVFAMSKEHANRLREVFEEMYPQHVGLLTVIHHGVERVHDGPWGRGLINRFKHENRPRIAISVDMLDTGVDVPEVMNLVFMRPVQSRIKLWQMIGRGTRSQEACNYPERLPANGKNGFLILDFWQNDFGRRIDPPQPAELPILVRLFKLRIDLLEAARLEPAGFACQQAIRDLRAMLARVPVDSFLIQREWHRVERAWRDHFWQFILPDSLEYLRTEIAPLLRHVSDVDLAAETFTLKVETLKLDRLRRRPSTPEALDSVVSDVARLPEDVHQNAARQASIGIVLSSTTPTLADATPQQLTQIITNLAGEMKRRRSSIPSFRMLDLPDFLMPRSTIILGPGMQPVYVNEYRQQVEARIQEILATSTAIAALQSGSQPTAEQLVELERLLHEQLGEESDLHLSSSVARRAFGIELTGTTGFLGFIRSLLDIAALPTYAEAVESGFNEHITAHAYSADQIRFLRAVQEVFVQRHSLQEADLYDPPFTQFGRNAADRLFTPQQKQSILDLTHDLAA